jgi:low affinity Fe/Cu permease
MTQQPTMPTAYYTNAPTDVRHRTTLGNRFRFLLRVLAILGFLAAPIGWWLAEPSLPPFPQLTAESIQTESAKLAPLAEGNAGLLPQVGVILLLSGVVTILLWLIFETLGGLFLTSGRKTAVSTNSTLQIALATALLVVVNMISFQNVWRWDLTKDKQFTLNKDLVEQLKKLRSDSPTTVVVLQLHKTAGTLSDRPDALDYAAERKVVEKVDDLVAQLREFGPRFNVVVLDAEDQRYEREVKALTRTRPGLKEAISTAPENSIFFYADEKARRVSRIEADRLAAGTGARPAISPDLDDSTHSWVYPGSVSRMSFAEFYQLDKTASKAATPKERERLGGLAGGVAYGPGVRGAGNLVLIPRGNDAFVKRVLALEERKPRIGLAVIHPLLTSRESNDEYGAVGLRKSLESNGFEVIDILLKKWGDGPPTPTASTFEENRIDSVEEQYTDLTTQIGDLEVVIPKLVQSKQAADQAMEKADRAANSEEKVKHFVDAVRALSPFVVGQIRSEESLRRALKRFEELIPQAKQELAEAQRQLLELGPKFTELLRDDRAAESRRITDIKSKLKQYVQDLDLLIVPRLTITDVTSEFGVISPSLFNLSKDQSEVIQEFMKVGKPVLFAFGPTNVDRRGTGEGSDEVERIVSQLGIELGRQTILSDAEARAMVERRRQAFGTTVELPSLVLDLPEPANKKPNPLASALRTTAKAVDQHLDIRKSGYRPVYPRISIQRLGYVTELFHTGASSFNKDKPLPQQDYLPKFDPTKQDETKIGTVDQERRGPFPVGVALETPIPVEWLETKPEKKLDAKAPLGLSEYFPLAALSFTFDHGLLAAGLTLAGEKVARPKVRVVVIGHGGIFIGKKLDPAGEALLLHTVNWQLKREDRLPQDIPDELKWRYPRADLTEREFFAWRWSTFLGLPWLIASFGLIALMLRKMR